MTDETSRTAMLLPADLKDAVREKVGPRGMTDFAVAAMRAKLTGHDASAATQAQLVNDLRFARGYAQRLADSLACAGELEDRQERLMECGVPPWVDVTGWPEWAAALRADLNSAAPVPSDPMADTVVDTTVDSPGGGLEEAAGQTPISAPSPVDTPVDNSVDEHPAHDAPIEEWREYARKRGVPDLDNTANRSQIRTMLGIPHPNVAGAAGGERSRAFIPQDELRERADQVKRDAEVASFVARASNPPTGAPALAKETVPTVPPEPKYSQMRTCEPGCGEQFDVYVDGEFEKHIVHKHAALKAAAESAASVEERPSAAQAPVNQEPTQSRPPEGMETCPFHPEMAVPEGGECYKCTLENNGTDPSPTRPKNDLFEKLQGDARGLGLDLRPASEVLRPEGKEEPYEDPTDLQREDEVPTEPASDLEVASDPASPAETRPAIVLCPNHPGNELPCALCCPRCGSELVDGECWECDL